MLTGAWHTGAFAQSDLRKVPSLERMLSEVGRTKAQSEKETVAEVRDYFRARREARKHGRNRRQS